ncbi:MAG: UPF0147 family protein [Nanoarchaeota archaeon]|nr:UPF0147 family protein [Nanoarchaeota archaeon]
MNDSELQVIDLLQEISEDDCISNGAKQKIMRSIETMSADSDVSLKANKVLSELEDLLETSGMDTYIRTQIWSVTSLLETL